MRTPFAAIVIALSLFVPAALEAQPDPRTTINLVATGPDFPACDQTTWIETAACDALTSTPPAGERLVWVVVSDPDGFDTGVRALQFGIEHDVQGLVFIPCGDALQIPDPGWPASGTSIAIAFPGACAIPATSSVRVGAFVVPAGATGRLALVPSSRTGTVELGGCTYTDPICTDHLGAIDVVTGGTPVCATEVPAPPTDVSATTDQCPIVVSWAYTGDEPAEFVIHRDGAVLGYVDGDQRSIEAPVTSGIDYTFRVAAVSPCGAHAWAGESAVGHVLRVPAVEECVASDDVCHEVVVTWEPSPGAIGHRIVRNGGTLATVGPEVGEHVDEQPLALPAEYRIVAIGPCADAPPSKAGEGRPQTVPLTFNGVQATDGSECGVVQVTWPVVDEVYGEVTCRVYRDGALLDEVPAEDRIWIDATGVPATSYLYAVAAVNACGEYADVDSGYAGGGPPPAPVWGAFDAVHCGDVVLRWSDPSGTATAFRVWRDGNYVTTTHREFHTDHATPGATYSYTAQGISTCGDGPIGPPLEVEVPEEIVLVPPEPIAPGSECVSGDSLTFAWHPVPGAAMYELGLFRQGGMAYYYPTDTTLTIETPSLTYTLWSVSARNVCSDTGPGSQPRGLFHDADHLEVSASLVLTSIGGDTWGAAWDPVEGAEEYLVTVSPLCHTLDTSSLRMRVAGTDTTFAATGVGTSEPGEELFYAWVAGIACGATGDSTECVPNDPDLVPVRLEDFSLTMTSEGVAITWRTSAEVGLLGFDLYREESNGAPSRRLNDAPITGGTTTYEYIDEHAAAEVTYTYVLVERAVAGPDVELARATIHTASPAPAHLAIAVRPNPFNPRATITLLVPHPGDVVVDVLDAAGRRVVRLADGPLTAGEHAFLWEGRDDAGRPVASGVYFVRARSPKDVVLGRMTLLK